MYLVNIFINEACFLAVPCFSQFIHTMFDQRTWSICQNCYAHHIKNEVLQVEKTTSIFPAAGNYPFGKMAMIYSNIATLQKE